MTITITMTNILFLIIIYLYILYIISFLEFKDVELNNITNNDCTKYEFFISDLTVSFSYSNNLSGKEKPNLTIDVNPSTGNEGLDSEKEWRKKSAHCEHENRYIYEADENDNNNPMLCDFTNDDEDTKDQTINDQSSKPKKHRAVEHEGDWAYVCADCHAITCKDCMVYYPSEENTPVPSPKADENEKTPVPSPNADKYENENNNKDNNNEDSSYKEENPLKEEQYDSDNKNITNDKSNKSSLIDDFANTECEMPDYTGGDD